VAGYQNWYQKLRLHLYHGLLKCKMAEKITIEEFEADLSLCNNTAPEKDDMSLVC
jgi:hypothetical protein